MKYHVCVLQLKYLITAMHATGFKPMTLLLRQLGARLSAYLPADHLHSVHKETRFTKGPLDFCH